MISKWLWLIPGFILLSILSCCSPYRTAFTETEWRKDIHRQHEEDLYAPHFKDGVYFNPWMSRKEDGFMGVLQRRLSPQSEYTQEERDFKPAFIPNLKERIASMPEGDFIAWIGHNTFLIRLGKEYFLTDPMFSERALLPKRTTPPALTAEAVNEIAPNLNIILSHNHYDHLDTTSLKTLSGAARVFVPAGLRDYVQKLNKRDVREMDWWQSIDIDKETRIVCLPAQHWSNRLFQRRDSTLWAGYLVITPGTTIYFGGDSGYFKGYKEIGRVYPGITYAILSTGAMYPRWFMHYSHMDIDEAIDAFHDLGAQYFVPGHWGAFKLGDEPPGYPVLELKKKITERDLDPSRFLLMDLGQIVSVETRR